MSTALTALLQLASAALPIGGFSYSQGMEAAVAAGIVFDRDSAESWIRGQVLQLWARGEARLWPALFTAWQHAESGELRRLNTLALESTQTGRSLALWLLALPTIETLDDTRRHSLQALKPLTHLCAHAVASQALGLDPQLGLHALGWSQLEASCAAAVKLVPLGQQAGQHILRRLAVSLSNVVDHALASHPENCSNFAPMLSILGCQHETQYSRIFRS